MARQGIQYQDVQQAIDELKSRGDLPSVQRIRDLLGTGSYTTINEHLRTWRQETQITNPQDNSDTQPPASVNHLTDALWRKACQLAEENLAKHHQQADEKVQQAHEKTKTARQEAADATQREQAIIAQCQHLQDRLEALSSELANNKAEIAHWQKSVTTLEHAHAEQRASRQTLEARLTQAQKAHEDAYQRLETDWRQRITDETARSEALQTRLLNQLDNNRQTLDKVQRSLKEQITQRDHQLAAKHKAQEAANEDIRRLNTNVQQYRHELDDTKRRHALEHEQSKKLEKENQRLKKRLSDLEKADQQATQERERTWQSTLMDRLERLENGILRLPTEQHTASQTQANQHPQPNDEPSNIKKTSDNE